MRSNRKGRNTLTTEKIAATSGQTLKAAFPHTIPVLLGYVFMGMAFGILLSSKGYSFFWAFFMALTIFAGTGQFVAINMLVPGFGLLNTVIMQLMVNARHIFYGLSLLDKFKSMGWKKIYMIFALTDETYSLLCSAKAPEGISEKKFYFLIALLDHCYWIIGCTFGAMVGSLFPFDTTGVDFVMTALFIVIFLDQWKEAKFHIPAVIGLIGSMICLLVFGIDNFLIPALLVILIALTAGRSFIEPRADGGKGDEPC
ncbi:MAG TPA: AzlC family ABC transporter permease [Firmicutes bacterium]|nr:AzlC family ABC transporter permease [Bacillota bacterium]